MKRHETKIVKEAIKLAKRIGVAPANLMTPTILADEARKSPQEGGCSGVR